MQYKITTIPPSGRHKYGNYLSAGNISKMIVTYDNNGNGTSGVGDKEDSNKDEQPIQKNYALVLSKTTNNFEWDDVVANNGVTDIVKPIGYGDLEIVPVFVGDISIVPKDTNDVASKRNYDIKGIEKGVTIAVKGNGTSAATIEIKVDESFEGTRGTLYIPCSVYSGPENQAPYLPSYDANGNLIDDIDTASDYSDWHMARENCKTLWLEYNFNITIPVTNHYTLELTNEIAGINCDTDGKIYPNAVRPTCQATMYLGSKEVSGATYSISIDESRNAQGVTINTSTGELTFGSNFTFNGTTLEVKVTGNANGALQSKIMTIVKQYPGADGTPATTRWVVPSVNTIKFNPNTNVMTPSSVSCKVMKQVGEDAPIEDTATTIYYGYNTTNPLTPYTKPISPDASKDYIAFALKNGSNDIYEIETIQIIKDGINGSSGSSVYRLTLTNENASINADSDGNIYPNANRPTCTATLYYGTTKVSGATYSITTNPTSTGVTINSTTGVITLDSTFNFTGTSLEITVTAMVEGVIYGTSIMTVSKSMAGKDGIDGKDGVDGKNGIDGSNGVDGTNGTSIIWKGDFASHPNSPENGWAYYNTAQKKSFVYQDGSWYQMTVDGIDGQDGKDGQDGSNGLSIVWKGDLVTAPSNPQTNWCYRDTNNGKVYIYNGSAWELMVLDGSDGADGTNGKDGLSVFITYNDNAIDSTPATPTGNGTTDGWHTDATKTANWMSQKVAASASEGTWGAPIQICGADGQNGIDGINGENGVSIVWKGEFASHPNNPENGWAYKNTTDKKSYVYQDGAWYQMTVDGIDGQNGKDGQDGSNGLSIVWKGDLASAPSNPQTNWCYRDTDNGKVYIYNGIAWELMVLDGSDGANGANGKDGLSVFITYHDNAITSTPSTPTENGTTNGWHTNATKAANWMSQKVAASASEGTWGAPIQICGADGQNGQDGQNGSDGADAVSYWLVLSTTEGVVTKGETEASPNHITLQAYKQIGGNSPTEITSTGVIKWGYNTVAPQNTATTINNIDTASTYIMVHLIVDNVIYDRQTISILKDGADGGVGPQGRQGAAIRGPVDWKNQTTSRRWCNGTLTNASYPEEAEFIDIVVFNGTYYKCTTSYEGAGSETTAPPSEYWAATDKQYEFVSTNLLLAENAKINFQTSNELYLMDSNGNVTAGAAGGDSINFWAGANEPANGTFKVYNNGTMEATKGKFGVLEIGEDQWGKEKLYGTSTQTDGSLNNISIQPEIFKMEGADQNGNVLESVTIVPHQDTERYDLKGVITVKTKSTTDNGLYTNGMVEAQGFTKSINKHNLFSPFSPLNNLEITFVTDTNYFTESNGYWVWKGMYLNKVSTSTYPYVIKNSSGEWCFATSSTATSGVGTGIYTSDHIKQNNRLYIVI